jgi:hypothetical protein
MDEIDLQSAGDAQRGSGFADYIKTSGQQEELKDIGPLPDRAH